MNDAPSFTKGSDQSVLEDCGEQTATGWATAISKGPANESSQNLAFTVSDVTNSALFASGGTPAVSADGTLSYTPAAYANGSSDVTIYLADDGDTASGGANQSASITFTITVTAVNDAPSFTKGSDQSVLEDCGEQTATGWAADISKGPSDESAQALAFTVTSDNNGLFSVQPAIDAATGRLSYTPAADANGTATVTVTLSDNGGTANGGADASPAQTFTISMTPVNDAPAIDMTGSSLTVGENTGEKTYANWAENITVGPADEQSTQTPSFNVSADNTALFTISGQPAISAAGTLTFTPVASGSGLTASDEDVTLKVSADGYQDNARTTQISFARSESGTITENFLLSVFTLELEADPAEILGDGKSETSLTATVTDKLGNPISGVLLTFYSDKGTFSGSTTAITGPDSSGSVNFISEKLSGTEEIRVPVTVSVSDEERKLYGTACIYERFVPGFVAGIVTDGNEDNQPVEGATVTVYKDFDGDGTIDFTVTFGTGADGKYSIAIPKGGIEYNISITKPVRIGDTATEVTFEQTVHVGDVTGAGGETSNPTKSASGVVIQKSTDGASAIVNDLTAMGMTFRIADSEGNPAEDAEGNPVDVSLSETGVFRASGLTVGTYSLQVVHEMDDGSLLIVGRN